MNIEVSKSFLKWKKNNLSNSLLIDAVDNFLIQVFYAQDITLITPQPKSVGNNLRKSPGTVNEFVLGRRGLRLYAKCGEFTQGQKSFRLAMCAIKNPKTQTDTIRKALSMFDNDVTEEWETWKPSAEQENLWTKQHAALSAGVQENIVTKKISQPEKRTSKKGKPLDENGLTTAERKALRRKEEQEKQGVKQPVRKRKKKVISMQKNETKNLDNTASESLKPLGENVPPSNAKVPQTNEVKRNETPVPEPTMTNKQESKSVKKRAPQNDDFIQNLITILELDIRKIKTKMGSVKFHLQEIALLAWEAVAEILLTCLKIEQEINNRFTDAEDVPEFVQTTKCQIETIRKELHSIYIATKNVALNAERKKTEKSCNSVAGSLYTYGKRLSETLQKMKSLLETAQNVIPAELLTNADTMFDKYEIVELDEPEPPIGQIANNESGASNKSNNQKAYGTYDIIQNSLPMEIVQVSVNDIPMPEQKIPTKEKQFEDVDQMHYDLEIVELQEQITTLNIQIQEHEIQKTRLEIEKKNLEIKKMRLLKKIKECTK